MDEKTRELAKKMNLVPIEVRDKDGDIRPQTTENVKAWEKGFDDFLAEETRRDYEAWYSHGKNAARAWRDAQRPG